MAAQILHNDGAEAPTPVCKSCPAELLSLGLAHQPVRAGTGARTHFLQERGLDSEILGHHVKAEEVAVNPGAGHREAVHMLVLLGCHLEQPEPLFNLNDKGREGSSCAVWLKAPRQRGLALSAGVARGARKSRRLGAARRDGPAHLTRSPAH